MTVRVVAARFVARAVAGPARGWLQRRFQPPRRAQAQQPPPPSRNAANARNQTGGIANLSTTQHLALPTRGLCTVHISREYRAARNGQAPWAASGTYSDPDIVAS